MKSKLLLLVMIITIFGCNEDKNSKTESKATISISNDNDSTSVAPTTTSTIGTENVENKIKNIGDDYCNCFSKAAEGINLAEIKLSEITNSKFQKQMEGFGKTMETCAGTLEAKYGKIDKETQSKVNKYLENNCKVMQDLMKFLEPEKKN
jgi:hypothetical protein